MNITFELTKLLKHIFSSHVFSFFFFLIVKNTKKKEEYSFCEKSYFRRWVYKCQVIQSLIITLISIFFDTFIFLFSNCCPSFSPSSENVNIISSKSVERFHVTLYGEINRTTFWRKKVNTFLRLGYTFCKFW